MNERHEDESVWRFPGTDSRFLAARLYKVGVLAGRKVPKL